MKISIELKMMVEIESFTNSLKEFLEKKPLYYEKIDYERMPKVFNRIKDNFKDLKIIHLIGTNGKGTTGRFLATALKNSGLKVGHYTSPHIVKFNERIWIDGYDIDDNSLETAHQKLQNILTKQESDSLSYFEYTTLLSAICFMGCDIVVMEAGLGGEYDATAVFEKRLTVVTPIDFDHQAFLGETINEIATTKLNAVSKEVVLSKQIHNEVYKIASKIALEKNVTLHVVSNPHKKLEEISRYLKIDGYLKDNLNTVLHILDILHISFEKESFRNSRLFGRLTKIAPNIIVDVGHNILAAKSIKETLFSKKYVLVYNSLKDKDYLSILKTLRDIIDEVEIIKVDGIRVEENKKLEEVLQMLDIRYRYFDKIQRDKNYLVFGSFLVVEEFLKSYE